MDLKSKFRHVLDFPEEGIDFIDITTVLGDAEAFKQVMDEIIDISKKYDFDIVVAPESRGFILGTPIAYKLGKAFAPIRKKGKLPYKTIDLEYKLEYGSNILEIHADAVKPGQRVLVVDDLLATGGTTSANVQLVEKLGGIIAGVVCMVELTYLNGRDKLKNYKVESLIKFDS
ncbi:MAG: adenine phosphoribosyltransferase [Clostridiales bacterium]|nr:adenine phosphoribosyltransferase [Clostridiales bacterium]